MKLKWQNDPCRLLIIDDHPEIRNEFQALVAQQSEAFTATVKPVGENNNSPVGYVIECAIQVQSGLECIGQSLALGLPYSVLFVNSRLVAEEGDVGLLRNIYACDPDLQLVLYGPEAGILLSKFVAEPCNSDNLSILKTPFEHPFETGQYTRLLVEKWLLARKMRLQAIDLDKAIYQRTQELLDVNARLEQEAWDRVQTEQALETEKHLLDVTLQSISDGVITTDVQGRILFMNRSAGVIIGWKDEEARGKPFSAALPPRYPEHVNGPGDLVAAVLVAGTWLEFQHPIMLALPDGSEKRVIVNGAPLTDAAGGIIGVVFTFRDTTLWHLLEAERFKANKMESIGVLAGGIAHDFNNILTAILGNISGIRASGLLAERQQGRLIAAENATRRAELLTKQLLTFSKGGAPILKPGSIRSVILESMDFILGNSGIVWRYEIPDDLWTVTIDEGQMSQVINNLAINAQQAMPEGGTIMIRGINLPDGSSEIPSPLTPGQYVRIAFTDDGIGIPGEHLPNIFDPYFSTKHKGDGLGLASTYSIIKNHNGYVSVESDVGIGTTFLFYLPATPMETVVSPERASSPMNGHGRILIMDDEEDIRNLCQDLLTELGYQVVGAADGEEAIERYQQASRAGQPFDLVLLDLTIPGGMGGKETVQRLKELDPKVKAIVASGYSADPVMADHKAYGFFGVLEKPFDFVALAGILGQIIER